MGNNSQCIFKFLHYSVDSHAQWNNDEIDINWHELNRFANKQAITGIVFEGIKKLGEQGLKPPFNLLMEWIGLAEQIANQNKKLNKRCIEVIREYQEAGFQCCLLKGQGNATMRRTGGRTCFTNNWSQQ